MAAGDDEAAWLTQAAAQLTPSIGRNKAGALRTYLRVHYDALVSVKESRGLSWAQVAALLQERGLSKENGAPLDGNAVAVMAGHVRWERSPRSRKRPRPKAHPQPSASAAAPPASATPPVEMPAPPQSFQGDRPRRQFGTALNPRPPREN